MIKDQDLKRAISLTTEDLRFIDNIIRVVSNDEKNGEFFEFYHDGVVWEHGYFSNGDYDGEYTTYFIDGKIKN